MKAITESFIGKKLFNFYTLFIIIALSFAIPSEASLQSQPQSAFYVLIEKISFWIFDEKSAYSAYFPAFFALLLPLGLLHQLSEKIKTSKLAFLNCAILSATPGFIFFTKNYPEESFALSLALGGIYACFFKYFYKEINPKYFWTPACVLFILSALINHKIALAAIVTTLFCTFLFKTFEKFDVQNFKNKSNFDKFLTLNIVSALTAALFAVLRLIPPVMIYPFISGIIGHFLYIWIFKNEKNKVKKSIIFLAIILVSALITGSQ